MADQGPPRLVSGELETLHALMQYQRDSLVRKVDGLDDAAARQELVVSGTSLLWLVKHLSYAERLWIVRRFAGENENVPDNFVHEDDTLAAAVEAYRATWARVDEITDAASLDDLCADIGDDPPVNLRWVLMHLLEETARHAGHADILRELIDGDTGR